MNGASYSPGAGRPNDERGISLGGVLRTITGVAGEILPGPFGIPARTVNRALTRTSRNRGRGTSRFNRTRSITPRVGGGSTRLAPLAPVPQPTQAQQARANAAAVGLTCPPGMVPNKTRYTLKSGEVVEPGTRCVKRRTMNPGNAKALRRSIRREEGFAKLARRALKGSRFKVVSASSGTRRPGPRTIVESGSGSVVTR